MNRPESPGKDGQYDRTTEYLEGDRLKLLTQSPHDANGDEMPHRKTPASRNEVIRLVIEGERVQLKCVAGIK